MPPGPDGLGLGPTMPDLGSPKHQFSTGFIRLFDIAKCYVTFTEKPNAFLILSRAISPKGLQKYQETTGFIRYFDQLSRTLRNCVLLKVFWCFAKS